MNKWKVALKIMDKLPWIVTFPLWFPFFLFGVVFWAVPCGIYDWVKCNADLEDRKIANANKTRE